MPTQDPPAAEASRAPNRVPDTLATKAGPGHRSHGPRPRATPRRPARRTTHAGQILALPDDARQLEKHSGRLAGSRAHEG